MLLFRIAAACAFTLCVAHAAEKEADPGICRPFDPNKNFVEKYLFDGEPPSEDGDKRSLANFIMMAMEQGGTVGAIGGPPLWTTGTPPVDLLKGWVQAKTAPPPRNLNLQWLNIPPNLPGAFGAAYDFSTEQFDDYLSMTLRLKQLMDSMP